MPFTLQYDFLYFCPHCRWKKHTKPDGDVLLLGFNAFDRCPNCGCQRLEKESIPKNLLSPERWLVLGRWLRK